MQNGAKPDFSRNPFSQQHGGNTTYQVAQGMVQIPAATIMAAQPLPAVQHYAHKVVQTSMQLPEQWQNSQMHHQSRPNHSNTHLHSEMVLNSTTVANLNRAPPSTVPPSRSATPPNHPNPQPSLYLQEPQASNSSRARQGFESNNHPYQNNRSGNYHHSYAGGGGGGAVPPPSGGWVGRSSVADRADRPEYESWSPDNSPSRRREYLPGRYHNEPSANLRNGYRHGKANQQDLVQPSGYHDVGNKRWQDRRR